MTSIVPTKLQLLDDTHLLIGWSDGHSRRYTFGELRRSCPCATCREKRKTPAPLLRVLTAEEAVPLKILGMKPVGNYAYSINFSDGHDTGIYSFTMLLEFGEIVEAAAQ
ncbi:MAG TPA: DUF971 domain-containing protein [Pirellulaceae bacterium]|nr:DUF971 domain-containing protein [Pirellulaceae bacterium]